MKRAFDKLNNESETQKKQRRVISTMRRSGGDGGGGPNSNSKNSNGGNNNNSNRGKGNNNNRGNSRWGNNNRSSNNNNSNKRGIGICFDFQNGSCRYGRNCKFLHGTTSQSSSSSNFQGKVRSGGGSTNSIQDSNRLIKQLKNTQQNNLADVICRAGPLWSKCWGDAPSSQMPVGMLEILLTTFAKVPFSQEDKVPPPPVHALGSAMKRYLTSSVDPLLAAETALNVVRKALSFAWEENKSVVKNTLGIILADAAGKLQRQIQDHRDCIKRIDECLDKLEKPWIIKEKQPSATMNEGSSNDEIVPGSLSNYHHSNWKNASIEWLLHGPTFTPTELPKMQGPSTKSRGVYKNREHYFDTMQRLMIAMAFGEGHSALSAQCWERSSGGHSCGGTLVQLPDEYNVVQDGLKNDGSKAKSSGPLRCRGRGCSNTPVFVCKVASHSRGLCTRCAHSERDQLLGPTGSTHVYNGKVARLDGASGKLYIESFFSRKPQMDENGMSLHDLCFYTTTHLNLTQRFDSFIQR